MNKRCSVVSFILLLVAGLAWSAVALAQETPDPTFALEDCLRYALQHSPDLQSARQGVVVAETAVRQARSSYSPQLTLEANDGFHGSSGGGNSAYASGADLALGMTFWQSGRQDLVNQVRAALRSTTASYADSRLSLGLLVADDYYAVLSAAELVGVAEAGVTYATQHRDQVQKQIDQGTTAPVEIHTVNDDLAQAQLNLIDARSDLRTMLVTLKADMGMPYSTDLKLAPAILGAAEAVPEETATVTAALQARPDLSAQRAVVEARRHALAVARTSHGPVLAVTGSAVQSYAGWSDSQSNWNVSAGVSWPLADGGYTAAGVKAAQANLTGSEADLQNLTNQATLAVQSALIELGRTAERIRASEDALTAATARLQSAEVKYREGLGILLEVTSARQDLSTAQAENVRARFAYQVARLGLQRATATLPLPTTEEVQP